MSIYVIPHRLVIHPKPAEFGLASKHDGPNIRDGRPLLVLKANRQIQFNARFGPATLLPEIVVEVIGVAPEMTMDINDRHRAPPRF